MELNEKPTHYYSIFFQKKKQKLQEEIYNINNQQLTNKILFYQRYNTILIKNNCHTPKKYSS